MKSVGTGVAVLDTHKGYLELTKDALEKLIKKESINEHYEVEQTPFARGKFAAVRRARCLRTGTWYAAKFMRKRRRAQDVRHEILHEAAVLLLTKACSRIVSLHQLYESSSEIILVLELAAGGELQRVIDEEEKLEESVVQQYMVNILSALRYLHKHNIAHLDLKPQNLLLMGQHPGSEVKLCDFGISRIILSDIEVREVLGTPDYVAPEILQYEPISLATDMWSVGVLTYVLLTGHSPFGGDTKQETFLNISQGQVDFPEDLFEDVSERGVHFISHLLVVEPSGRLTIDEALEHPWLRGLSSALPGSSPSASPVASPSPEAEAPSPPTPPAAKGETATATTSSARVHIANLTLPTEARGADGPGPCVTTSLCLNREADGTWRATSDSVNKENNKNSINKEEAFSPTTCREVVLDSPSRSRSRLECRAREADPKKGKENKEVKEPHRERLKPSPLASRRQGSSKCDLNSPTEQQKFGPMQGSVGLRLEKGIIY